MTRKTNAKQVIVNEFIARVEAGSLKAVHVSKLIKELGINRNTFYYHFTSKYDVAMYVFRTDLARELTEAFPKEELVYSPVDAKNGAEELPFYTHREIAARTLDSGGFYKALVRCLLKRQAFYHGLFDRQEPEFLTLIDSLYRPAAQSDLEFILGGRYLPEPTFELLVTLISSQVPSIARYYLLHSRDAELLLDDKVNPFWNITHETLLHELQNHPINRPRNM